MNFMIVGQISKN